MALDIFMLRYAPFVHGGYRAQGHKKRDAWIWGGYSSAKQDKRFHIGCARKEIQDRGAGGPIAKGLPLPEFQGEPVYVAEYMEDLLGV